MSDEKAKALNDLGAFFDEKGVGKYIVVRSHTGSIAIGVEKVIKCHELDDEIMQLARKLATRFGALKIHIICKAPGEPDRLEIFQIRG